MYAGILPYYIDSNGTIWLLLGRERQSASRDSLKWGGFGGLVEANETFIEAAAREGYEESMGVLGTYGELLACISEGRSFPLTSRFARHYLLKMRVKDDNLPTYFERFYQYASKCAEESGELLPLLSRGAWEKCEISWIPLLDIALMKKEMRPMFLRDVKDMPVSIFK